MSDAAGSLKDAPDAWYLAHRPQLDEVIDYVCRRRGLRGEEAKDFFAEVHFRLVASNYEMLRRFEGRSRLDTYLTVVIGRLALDFQAARWGKWRPSATARAGGPPAVALERLCIRDGMPVAEALRRVSQEFGAEADLRRLEDLAPRFPLRTRRHYLGDALLEAMPAQSPDAEALLVREEEQQRFEDTVVRLRELMSGLSDQHRTILQLRFEQGLTVAQIARMTGLDQKRLYRTIEATLASLRKLLAREGMRPAWPDEDRPKTAAPVRLYERQSR